MRAISIVIGAGLAVSGCGPAPTANAQPSGPIILQCDGYTRTTDGDDLRQRRTYRIDLAQKTLEFWSADEEDWWPGYPKPVVTFETKSELTFESTAMLDGVENTHLVSFNRLYGSVHDITIKPTERLTYVSDCVRVERPTPPIF